MDESNSSGDLPTNQRDWWKSLKGLSLNNADDNEDDDLMHTWQGKAQGYNVPEFGWRIALSHKFKDHPIVWSFPPLSQIPSVLGLAVRYLQYYNQLRHKNKRPCMDFFNQTPLHQIYGVPLGGIGGGTINRGWQGGFCKWQLKPGVYTYDCPLADQFTVCIRRHDKTVFQQVLSTRSPSGEPLRSWNWRYCGSYAYYHGLYPRAWTVYDLQGQDIILTCRQISPVFPHDYKDTSIPAGVFVWTVQNKRDDDAEVTIVMSMENGIGPPEELVTCETGCCGSAHEKKNTSSLWNENFSSHNHGSPVKGVIMYNTTYENMPYTMTVAASEKENAVVSRCTSFNPTKDGNEVWKPLLTTGKLHSKADKSHLTTKGEAIACAVACTCSVKANSTSEVDFCLTWDMPQIHFGDSNRFYKRRYTRFFGFNGKAGPLLADYSLNTYPIWEKKIEEWQSPILENNEIPAWYKSALFNELYYVTDGGTVWLESDSSDANLTQQNGHPGGTTDKTNSANATALPQSNGVSETPINMEEKIRNCEHICEFGRFAYLEGQEYKMYNTYDVHFYASIALVHLWPQLEISLQYDIVRDIWTDIKIVITCCIDYPGLVFGYPVKSEALDDEDKVSFKHAQETPASILHSNGEQKKYLMDGVWAPAKTPNCVPHDVGCPDDEPWQIVNAYFVHDTADWRDLNPKFVLQAFRDYHITKDKVFLRTMWPILKIVMDHSKKHDTDGDGLIENSGAADQTFDGWCMHGPSAYCGGLYLAALRFMVEAADVLGEEEEKKEYADTLKRGTDAYNKLLWNGKYYNYDSSRHGCSAIMADQCAGQWFLADAGISDVLPEANVVSALKTVFDLNVLKYDGGRHGAVNGMKPTGVVDSCSVQSVEVWTGVTYALAATMIHKGLFKEGFRTASGIYRTCWQRYGMSYQTPEAFRKNRTYRSLAYMRPLSIWGMQHALENIKSSK